MKFNNVTKLAVLFLLLITASACTSMLGNGGTPTFIDWKNGEQLPLADDQELSEDRKKAFSEDAEKLAVRHIQATEPDQKVIPEKLIDLYYNGLVHIFNTDYEATHEVFTEYDIRVGMVSAREIFVHVDESAPWIDAWKNGTTETGNTEVDSLINEYNFSLASYADSTATATLRSDHAINGGAVGTEFEDISGIEKAGFDTLVGGQKDITIYLSGNMMRYTFIYGWGDCPSGCINSYKWQFALYKDGSVEFVGEGGGELPES